MQTEIIITSPIELVNFASNGNPLISKMLVDHPSLLSDPRKSLTDTLIALISEDLVRVSPDCNIDNTIQKFRELSLINIPFRSQDIEKYIYEDSADPASSSNELIGLLVNASLLVYESKGYVLDHALKHLAWVEYAITQPENYVHSHMNLLMAAIDLQTTYPYASRWYDNILPESTIKLET